MELVNDFGIWKIVAHVAINFYSVACETFSTGSTLRLTRGGETEPDESTEGGSSPPVGGAGLLGVTAGCCTLLRQDGNHQPDR